MTDEQQIEEKPYIDLDFSDLQELSDYITKNSVPISMSIVEAQGIIDIYANLINTSLYNLNKLRAIAGEPEFPIPTATTERNRE